MRISPLAVRLFLAGCLAPSQHADAAFQLPATTLLKRQQQPTRYRQQKLLQEKTDWGFFEDLFKWDSSPTTRKSLGIEDDSKEDDSLPDGKPHFIENTGKPLPNWTPPPKPEPPKEAPPVEAIKMAEDKKDKEEAPADKKTPPPPKAPPVPMEPILTKETTEEISKSAKIVVEKVVNPIMGAEIEKGVPASTIQGASISAAIFVLTMTQSLSISALTLVTVALITITPGPLGETCRTIGDLIYDTLGRFWNLSEKLGVTDAVSERLARMEYNSKMERIRRIESEVQQVLQQAEETLAGADNEIAEIQSFQTEVKGVLAEADAAISNAIELQEDKMRLADQELKDMQLQEKAVEAEEKVVELARDARKLARAAEDAAKSNPIDLTIPYDAAAKLAYESSEKKMRYDAFKAQYEADAVADVIAKNVDLSIPYDAASMLAYEASDKSTTFEKFKAEFVSNAVADVIVKNKAKRAEAERLAEEARVEEERKQLEEQKRLASEAAAAAAAAEEARILEEQKQKEAEEIEAAEQERLQRLEEEKRLAEEENERLAEKQRAARAERLAEMERVAEEQRAVEELEQHVAEEQKEAFEQSRAEEQRKAEEQRLAEEEEAAKLAALDPVDEDDEDGFTDEDWNAAVEMAKDNVDGNIVGIDDAETDMSKKADWDAAGKLAQTLSSGQKEAPVFDDGEPDDIGIDSEMDMEELARAAREAVEKFEGGQTDVGADDAEGDDDEDDDFFSLFDDVTDSFKDITDEVGDVGDDIAEAARRAVEMFDASGAEDEEPGMFFDDEPPEEEVSIKADAAPPKQDWSKRTVIQLKSELKNRGLPTSGKKADLVAQLEENDKELALSDSSPGSEDEGSTELEKMSTRLDKASTQLEEMNMDTRSDEPSTELEEMTMDMDELGRLAREAAALFNGEEPSDEVLTMLENEGLDFMESMEEEEEDAGSGSVEMDYSSMTVNELKDECRKRGLKVGGRKAELVDRLQSSD